MFKQLPNEPTGATAARVDVSTSMSFDQMKAKQAAKQAAERAQQQADDTTLLPYDRQAVMNTAFMTGGPVPTTGPSAKPLNGAMVPSGTDFHASDTTGPTFADYFGGFTNDPLRYSTDVPSYSTVVPSSSTAVSMLAPPPKGASRVRQQNFMKFEGGRRLSRKSKKGGKKGVRKSASVKRCRRKGKRSRKVHRR